MTARQIQLGDIVCANDRPFALLCAGHNKTARESLAIPLVIEASYYKASCSFSRQ